MFNSIVPNVRIVKSIQVGRLSFKTAKAAARQYALLSSSVWWHKSGNKLSRPMAYAALDMRYNKTYAKILPVFERIAAQF